VSYKSYDLIKVTEHKHIHTQGKSKQDPRLLLQIRLVERKCTD